MIWAHLFIGAWFIEASFLKKMVQKIVLQKPFYQTFLKLDTFFPVKNYSYIIHNKLIWKEKKNAFNNERLGALF